MDNSCKFFQWTPPEPYYDANLLQPIQIKPAEKEHPIKKEQYLTNAFINDFANSLNIL